jgi:protein phosphatase 2C family protein 2/3
MTFCVVALLGKRTKAEWYAWVKERVEKQVGWETPDDIAPVFKTQGSGGDGSGGISVGRAGGMGGGSILSALAGNLGQGDDDDEEGQGGSTLRLSEGLAGA